MKVYPYKYYNAVCPHCKSKKLNNVSLIGMGNEHRIEACIVTFTGYLCGNCERYIDKGREKYMYDRAEMQRDIKRLQKFLGDNK